MSKLYKNKNNISYLSKRYYRGNFDFLFIAILLYFAYLCFILFYLHFDMMRSDVLIYWKNSLSLQKTLFSTWWVPGYSLLIALIRSVTFNLLPPIAIMIFISFTAYILATWFIFKESIELGWDSCEAKKIALFFATYPFVGLTYAVYPIADSLAIALFIISFIFIHKTQWKYASLLSGITMLVHKITWFFIPILLLFIFIVNPNSRKYIILAFIPIILLEIIGVFYHHNILWMIQWSKEHLMTPRSQFLLFDGLLGSLIYGDLFDKIKGIIVLIIVIWALSLSWISIRIYYWYGIIIGMSFIIMSAIINQYEIWVIIRFSKILILPSLVPLLTIKTKFKKKFLIKSIFVSILIFSIISNFLYGYYMAKIFFKN